MTSLFQITDDQDAPDDTAYADSECPCPKPDDQYLLEVDNGAVFLIHRACGKQPRGDYTDLVETPPVPVTVRAEPYGNCDGSEWHGEYRCDCGIALVATVNSPAISGGRLPFTRKKRTTAPKENTTA